MGLFSAVVATMLSVSIQDLKPNPQETSAFYLEKMYQLQANPNASRPSNTSDVATPPTFSPPLSVVAVNALWFLSLVMSLTCAMLATFAQQWARRYITFTQPARCSPHKRARVRAFFANGMANFHAPAVIGQLSGMIHFSLILFFTGLIVYLHDIHIDVFHAVLVWLIPLLAAWTCVMVIPRFWVDFPYYVTKPLWEACLFSACVNATAITSFRIAIAYLAIFGAVVTFYFLRAIMFPTRVRNWILPDRERIERAVSSVSLKMDINVLDLTAHALGHGEDDAREKFFESIPGFYKSDVVKDLPRCLPEEVRSKISNRLVEFLRHTLSSNTVSELAKFRRLAICLAAADVDISAESERAFQKIVYENWREIPQSVEFAEFLTSWDKRRYGRYTQWIIANVLAHVDERDDRWMALAMDYLGIPEPVLRDYLAHGDSLLLAILIHSTRHAILSDSSIFRLLPPLSDFDVHNTLPGLQRDFCTLWNTLVQRAQDPGDPSPFICILKATRHIYVALHRGTDAAPAAFSASTEAVNVILDRPSSYPICNIPGHHPDSTPHVNDASAREASIPEPAAITPIISSSLPASESHPDVTTPPPADEPSLGDLPSPIIQPFHPTCQVPPFNPTTPVDSAEMTSTHATTHHSPISVSATRDPHSTLAATNVTDAPQHDTDHRAVSLSMAPGTQISSFPTSHPDDVLPTDLQSCSESTCAARRSDQSPPVPDLSPPNPTATPPLTARQGSPILDRDVALNNTEFHPPDDSQDENPPTPTVAPHYVHSTKSDSDITRELSTRPPDSRSSHDPGPPP